MQSFTLNNNSGLISPMLQAGMSTAEVSPVGVGSPAIERIGSLQKPLQVVGHPLLYYICEYNLSKCTHLAIYLSKVYHEGYDCR